MYSDRQKSDKLKFSKNHMFISGHVNANIINSFWSSNNCVFWNQFTVPVNSIVSLNVPSSKGVSAGPNMTAFQSKILLSVGAPETPAGGSSCNRLKSRINLRRADVDILNVFSQMFSKWIKNVWIKYVFICNKKGSRNLFFTVIWL